MFGGDQQSHADQRWRGGLRTAAGFHLLHGLPSNAEDDADPGYA